MQIDVQAQGFNLADDVRLRVVERLGAALKRVEAKVRDVKVRLSKDNGRQNGVCTRCHVEVRMEHFPSVVIQDERAQLQAVIDSAAKRLRRTVAWAIVRRRPVLKSGPTIKPQAPRITRQQSGRIPVPHGALPLRA